MHAGNKQHHTGRQIYHPRGGDTGLHVAVGRDLNPDGTVDVLGTQLEEVVE